MTSVWPIVLNNYWPWPLKDLLFLLIVLTYEWSFIDKWPSYDLYFKWLTDLDLDSEVCQWWPHPAYHWNLTYTWPLNNLVVLTLTSTVKSGTVAPSTLPTMTSSSVSHSFHAHTGLSGFAWSSAAGSWWSSSARCTAAALPRTCCTWWLLGLVGLTALALPRTCWTPATPPIYK